MPKGTVLLSGIFCTNCEYVEDVDNLANGVSCLGCGCSLESHVKADVIQTD